MKMKVLNHGMEQKDFQEAVSIYKKAHENYMNDVEYTCKNGGMLYPNLVWKKNIRWDIEYYGLFEKSDADFPTMLFYVFGFKDRLVFCNEKEANKLMVSLDVISGDNHNLIDIKIDDDEFIVTSGRYMQNLIVKLMGDEKEPNGGYIPHDISMRIDELLNIEKRSKN